MIMKPERLTAIFFLSVIAGLMVLVPVTFVINQVNKLSAVHEAVNINIDWSKLYPFKYSDRYIPKAKSGSLAEQIKFKVEEYYSKNIASYHMLAEAGKKYEDFIGWNMAYSGSYNPVIKLHEDYLVTLTPYEHTASISKNAEEVTQLAEFCRNIGTDFLYIHLPGKVCPLSDESISGILDYSNQNADRLLQSLAASGVRTCDLRIMLHADSMNHHDAFYRTDHHWKAETGLWAAKHILKILRENYSWNVEPEILAPKNFDRVVYPEWFLGSQGKKITLARTKPDDFSMLYPKYETLIHYEIPSKRVNISGDFRVTYNMSQVLSKDYYGKTPYRAYNFSDKPSASTHNFLNNSGKKILIVHDSFGNSVVPFLAMSIEDTEEIDVRYFTGSLRTYITVNSPDLVIVMYDLGNVGLIEPNSTLRNQYDFR